MPVHLALALVFLLAIAIPAGQASAQGNTGEIGSIPDLAGDATDTVGNTTDIIDYSPFVNETSSLYDIVINEVELNPRESDVSGEWIELYNPASVDVNISDYEIRTSFKSATIRLPPGAIIEANETYVIELDRQILSNAAESLDLANESGKLIDSTPSLVDRSDDGRTWQRIPDGNNEWQFAAGTHNELNDPDGQVSATRSARSDSAVCHGTAGCAEGVAVRIVDGDTLHVKVNTTIYKVDLALASAPSNAEQKFKESTSLTRNLCLGNDVLVDQDDKLLTSDTSIIAVVYCASTNLNSELLDSGYATLNMDQCRTSEFGSESWAIDYGC